MVQTQEVEYQAGTLRCRGFIAYDNQKSQPQPCIMIAPDWSGRTEAFCTKAKHIAQMGYVGFAIDMYGEAKTGNTTEEKQRLLNSVISDRNQVNLRILSAFKTAATLGQVNQNKIAAIGYCFGGLCVLDLARTGADVKGVVSFHGLLSAPEKTSCNKILSKILVLHGYDDPMVPPSQVNQFADEMTQKKADWQIHMYGHTTHSFTNPEANDPVLGLKYNKNADQRSWKTAELFFNELFA